MKTIVIRNVITILLVLVLQNSSSGEKRRCLFIGDSFFSHNDLSKEFLNVWNEQGSDTLIIANHNCDGATIVSQWMQNSSALSQILRSQKWDYVIIELPPLAKPQDSSLNQILHNIDSILSDCRILCIPIDFCIKFPEMACIRDAIEGVKCNEYLNCNDKLQKIAEISEEIVNQKYKNLIQIIPFSHYRSFLYDQYSIELGSDDEYGHPSPSSQNVLARFILFHILYLNPVSYTFQTNNFIPDITHILPFYNYYNNEKQK